MDAWLWLTTVLSGITLVLTVVLAARMPAAFLTEQGRQELSDRLSRISGMLDFAPAAAVKPKPGGGSRAVKSGSALASSPSQQGEVHTGAQPEERTKLADRIEDFHDDLRQWCAKTEVDLRSVLPDAEKLQGWVRDLSLPRGAARLEQIAREFATEAECAAKAAVSRSDRDIDKRKDGPGQGELRALVQAAGLRMIDPRPGERVDLRRHTHFGTRTAPDQRTRGTVAEVATRGLSRTNGEVIAKAEVYLYD